MDLVFDRQFDPAYGRAVEVSPLVRRVTAGNPGPFTFCGTNTFIVGHGCVAVIDPGPNDPAHLAALMTALDGETVTHILVTHSHSDHVGGAAAFAEATHAPILAHSPIPHRHSEPPGSIDYALQADAWLRQGAVISGMGWTIEAIETPGHLADHLCFALREEDLLFSGDHVMAWSTTVVLPPHGSMRDYRASLAKLLSRPEDVYLPAHGPQLRNAKPYVEALIEHRDAREAAILSRVAEGPTTIPEIVARLYPGLDPQLVAGASGSVESHLIELADRGLVRLGAGSPATVTLVK